MMCLSTESVQGTSLPLEGIDDIHGGDGLPLGVFGVGDGIPDDVLKEDLEDSTGLLVDESGDTLDSTTTRQTPDGGLGDALDVIPQHLPVPLGTSLAESLASFASSSHVDSFSRTVGFREIEPLFIPFATPAAKDSHWPSISPRFRGLSQHTDKRTHSHSGQYPNREFFPAQKFKLQLQRGEREREGEPRGTNMS